MKTIKLAYDEENTYHNWIAIRDDRNSGWVVTDHQGDKKFYDGCFDAVIDQIVSRVLPNWGMRIIAVR